MTPTLPAPNWVTRRAGKREASRSARVSASPLRMSEPPAAPARIARRPVPAEGSSTRSVGEMAVGCERCQPEHRRRELLEGLRFLGAARVCVGSRSAIRQDGKTLRRRSGVSFYETAPSAFAQEQDGGDSARLRRFSSLQKPTHGCAKKWFHGAAHDQGIDTRRVRGGRKRTFAAARTAVTQRQARRSRVEGDGHRKSSGERERNVRTALSLEPVGLIPSRRASHLEGWHKSWAGSSRMRSAGRTKYPDS